MRKLVTLSLATAISLGMVVPGIASANSTQSGANTTLTIWWWGQQEANGASHWMTETVRDFEELHPNVKIQTVLQTTNGLYPAFEAAAQAKKGPDIEYLWGGINTLTEAWKGYVAPIDQYIPKSEWSHYLNWQEDYYGGHLWSAPWYTQPSFPILYNKVLFAKAGLNPNKPPATWAEFLNDCAVLKAHHITPVTMGVQDGWLGGWLFSEMGDQNLNSVNELLQAQVNGTIDQPKFSEWLTKLAQLKQRGYINSNATSLQLYQGQAIFSQGKAAMTWVAGSAVKNFVDQMGVKNVGIMLTPVFGHGKMAGTIGATSQTLAITSFSQHKQLAAQFVEYAHSPARLKAFYDMTGSIPADGRFSSSNLAIPQQQLLWNWMLHKPDAYGENFISGQLDSDGNFAGLQDILTGSKTPAQVGQIMQSVVLKWRQQNPIQVNQFKAWSVTPWYH